MPSGALHDKVCLVTGGARGIGCAVIERFLEEGARGVVVVDRSTDALTAAELPPSCKAVVGDVRNYATHERAVAAAVEAFGRLDVLVANAGVFDFRKRLDSYTPELLSDAMDELFGINVRGYLFAVRAAVEQLRANRGAIVFTGSVASVHAGGGGVLYTAAKHAVVGLARQLALELSPEVRVNIVAPGGTDTALGGTEALGHQARALNGREGFKERIAGNVPLGFAQSPADHAAAYVFFASNKLSPAVTGEILMSDGGVGIRHL